MHTGWTSILHPKDITAIAGFTAVTGFTTGLGELRPHPRTMNAMKETKNRFAERGWVISLVAVVRSSQFSLHGPG